MTVAFHLWQKFKVILEKVSERVNIESYGISYSSQYDTFLLSADRRCIHFTIDPKRRKDEHIVEKVFNEQ